MAEHNKLGKWGEETVCQYLVKEGYAIVERNWRMEHLEIDIIAEKEGWIVFVEVKTRRTTRYGLPQEAVHPAKQMNLRRAATQWLAQQTPKVPHIGIRFDVMAVQVHGDEVHMHHIPEAF